MIFKMEVIKYDNDEEVGRGIVDVFVKDDHISGIWVSPEDNEMCIFTPSGGIVVLYSEAQHYKVGELVGHPIKRVKDHGIS